MLSYSYNVLGITEQIRHIIFQMSKLNRCQRLPSGINLTVKNYGMALNTELKQICEIIIFNTFIKIFLKMNPET